MRYVTYSLIPTRLVSMIIFRHDFSRRRVVVLLTFVQNIFQIEHIPIHAHDQIILLLGTYVLSTIFSRLLIPIFHVHFDVRLAVVEVESADVVRPAQIIGDEMFAVTALAHGDDDTLAVRYAGDGVRIARGADLAGVLDLKFGRDQVRMFADDDAILLRILACSGSREVGTFGGIDVICFILGTVPEG